MSSSDDKLAAKVEVVNFVNIQAKFMYSRLVQFFTPLVGSLVCKKDGGLLAKVEKQLPKGLFPNTSIFRIYRHSSEYHLAWTVWVSKSVNGCVGSHDVTVYVGRLTDGVLMELCESFVGRMDWTPREVVAKREAYWAAKRAAEDFKEAFYPFGEYDT
jgi:hypothetical protein